MNSYITLVISIGVLAFVDTYMTATIPPIPVWVTFIAWASFFACGGGEADWVQSVISNWTGILVAGFSMLVSACFGFVSEIFAKAMTTRKPITA